MTAMNYLIFNASVIIFLWVTVEISCIWPPAYKVNLTDEGTFEIFETIKNSEVQDVYDEEELVKRQDMDKLGVKPQLDKFFRIHNSLQKSKEIVSKDEQIKKKVFETLNPDREYPLPWKGGFVDQDGNFKDEDIVYFNEEALKPDERKQKRDKKLKTKEENYDYSQLKKEYENEVKTAAKANETVQNKNVDEDGTLRKAIVNLVEKTSRNCTEEERKGIGIGAMECFFSDLNKAKMKNRTLEKLVRILIIWFAVYIFIAIPCWCQYGWCCCCFRCKFCRPREEIEEVKTFFVNNPPGIYHDKDGNVIEYQPTFYEKYAQRKVEQELKKL
ncbi:hypothetical protein JTB14_031662 [Gonioctena quinquepunctata]|nr:hypothetical protein JTB14_031662 [Gonioctena quinquepunctata]